MKRPNPYISGLILIFLSITLFFSYRFNQRLKFIAVEDQVLGTFVTIKAYGRDSKETRRAIEKALKEMERIDKHFDVNHQQSETAKLNSQAGQGYIKVSSEMLYLLDRSVEDSKTTNQNFNPAIWPLVNLWDFTNRKKPPNQKEISESLKFCNPKKIKSHSGLSEISLDDGLGVDLGGLLKGYAVDKALSVLQKEGISRALVDAGSSQGAIGKKPDNQAWKIGIQNPNLDEVNNQFIATIELNGFKYVSTSGDYQQSFIYQGKRYHHILNSKTGWPVDDYRSVTVLSNNSATEADMLSTAVFAAGYPEGLRLLKKYSGSEAIFVLKNGEVKSTIQINDGIDILLDNI